MKDEVLKIFIGWSKQPSKDVARVLNKWLLDFFQYGVELFMSEENIKPGEFSRDKIVSFLRDAKVGIFCLTLQNTGSEWINSESGALIGNENNQTDDKNLIIPFLFGMNSTDTSFREKINGLIKGYHAADSEDKESIKKMMVSINEKLDRSYDEEKLNKKFEMMYPQLQKALSEISKAGDSNDQENGRKPIEASLTQWEHEILWLIYQRGNAGNRFFTSLTEIDTLVTSGQFTYGEIFQAHLLLEIRGYIEKKVCGVPGYYLTVLGIQLMGTMLQKASQLGYLQKDCKLTQ